MLKGLGFNVLTADDGRQEFSPYRDRADEITCVLLDLTLPIMDGDEAFRQISEFSPGAKIILGSGVEEQSVTKQFAGRSLNGFTQAISAVDADPLAHVMG
jgi:two-component system cell cycle sensor histidine kinase/response regulator CckA